MLDNGGYFGFSWTTFCFGFIPALFRCDFRTFLGGFAVSLILGLATFGIAWFVIGIIWAFMYNKYYTKKLIEQGYVFDDYEIKNAEAAESLGLLSSMESFSKSMNKKCPFCAETIKYEAVICRYCGKKQPTVEQEELSGLMCIKCGLEVSEYDDICPHCEYKFEQTNPASALGKDMLKYVEETKQAQKRAFNGQTNIFDKSR